MLYREDINPNLPVTYARVLADGTIIEYNEEPRIVRRYFAKSKNETQKQNLNTQSNNISRGDTGMEPSAWFRPLFEPLGRAIGVPGDVLSDVAGPEFFSWLVQIPVNLIGKPGLGRHLLNFIIGGGLMAYAALAKPTGRAMRDTLHVATHFLNRAADIDWFTIGGIASGLEGIKASVAKGDVAGVLSNIFYTPEEVRALAESVKDQISGLVSVAGDKKSEEAEENPLQEEINRLRKQLEALRMGVSVEQQTAPISPEEEEEEKEKWLETSI